MTLYRLNIISTFLRLIFLSPSVLILSCNSYKSIDPKVERSIQEYEVASNEIISEFKNILKLSSHDSGYKGCVTIYVNNAINNLSENPSLYLPKTIKLCHDSLAQYIFLGTDSTICFNLKNSTGSNFYRHLIIFQSNDRQPNIDLFMTHSYKIINTKKIKPNWTYLIIKQFFD